MNVGASRPSPRVALVTVELGRIQRGFERYFNDLFGVFHDELDITLYKGGGRCNSHEKIPPLLRPAAAIARMLPLGERPDGEEYKQYKRDCLAFGLSLLPELLRNRYDVIHCIDPPLAKVLQHLQGVCRFRARLLFTEGCVMPPQYYPRVAHIHHVAHMSFQEALAMGVPESHMTLIPCGVHTQQFEITSGRHELRKKYEISDETFVILAVSAVKRIHKRVDYIIEEASRLEGDVLLWIDGNLEDLSVPEFAYQKLGSRCRITHVPSSDVVELYHLADVMVHASLSEAFGLAVVEALCSGALVLTHDSPHFQWLVQDTDCLVDMRLPGNLMTRLRELIEQREGLSSRAKVRTASVRQRFDWRTLKPAYIEMYRKVASLNLSAAAASK
jgi:glycosyltransferase involved in cell wall biosynthesis